jgi:recombinational DNA repair ATPase RecF
VIIKRIKVERFRCFISLECELGPGLVVVRGPNEAGKSALFEAIVAGLWASPAADSEWIKSFLRWGEPHRPRGVLEVETERGTAGVAQGV